jgi:hypothetical protein
VKWPQTKAGGYMANKIIDAFVFGKGSVTSIMPKHEESH